MTTPTYTLIDSVTLSTTAASITFSSIPQTYRDLVIVFVPISTSAGSPFMRVNGDSSSIYYTVEAIGNGSTSYSFTDTAWTSVRLSQRLFSFTDVQYQATIQIMDYTQTDKHKSMLIRANVPEDFTSGGGNNYEGASMLAARWASTSAITSVLVDSGTLAAGTTAYLYGIAG